MRPRVQAAPKPTLRSKSLSSRTWAKRKSGRNSRAVSPHELNAREGAVTGRQAYERILVGHDRHGYGRNR